MRSSSFVFIFILGQICRNCVKIELYCVLVFGPKKQSSLFSVLKLKMNQNNRISRKKDNKGTSYVWNLLL